MKNRIGAVILGAAGMLACVSFVTAGELLAFDTVYKNPQAALKNQASAPVATTQPQAEESDTILPTMAEFLKDVPTADRLEFLSSLMLKNGHIVSAYIAPLKRTLSAERVTEILDAIYINRRLEKKLSFENPGAPSRYTELSELLKNTPSEVKNEFLDNLIFRDGTFASAYVGGLRKTVPEDTLFNMLRAMTTNPNAPADPKSLCWPPGVCQNAKCALVGNGSGLAKCKSTDVDWTCDDSCK